MLTTLRPGSKPRDLSLSLSLILSLGILWVWVLTPDTTSDEVPVPGPIPVVVHEMHLDCVSLVIELATGPMVLPAATIRGGVLRHSPCLEGMQVFLEVVADRVAEQTYPTWTWKWCILRTVKRTLLNCRFILHIEHWTYCTVYLQTRCREICSRDIRDRPVECLGRGRRC